VITPRFRDHGRMFGSTFNFDDHASFGFRQGEHGENEFTVRAEHFSNAGIKKPNPGQNFLRLRYARHF
jgi:lipid A 3-O-deacylase